MLKKLVVLALVAAALVFAIQGGEYGTTDLVKQRLRRQALLTRIDSLQRVVDSLGRRKRSIETDPAVQERIAREEFGMVRGEKEMLYRFAETGAGQGEKR